MHTVEIILYSHNSNRAEGTLFDLLQVFAYAVIMTPSKAHYSTSNRQHKNHKFFYLLNVFNSLYHLGQCYL